MKTIIYTEETAESELSTLEDSAPIVNIERTPVAQPVRMKLKDESSSNTTLTAQTDMRLTGYTTGFTEGETTQDELDDEIIESSIYIYKVTSSN